MDKRYDEDTKAILARREEFVKRALSSNEIKSVKGGSLGICLTILPPCCLIPDPCLSIKPT